MKKILIVLLLFLAIPVSAQFIQRPIQGGTGIGSALGGDIGFCLKVSDDSPFTYVLGSCGSGGGGSGNVATSTAETTGYIPFATSNSATPALIGFDSNFFWDNTNKRLGIGSSSPYANLSVVGQIVGAYFTATTTTTSTFPTLTSTDGTFTGSLNVPNNGTVNANGEITVDDTSGQFRYYAGSVQRVLAPNYYPSFTYATTSWTGTTTIPLGPAYIAETWVGIKCFTDTGTVNVSIYDGTNRMNLFNASTTVGTVSLSTNNTFTASEKRYADVGTPASSPLKISCTISKTYDAD